MPILVTVSTFVLIEYLYIIYIVKYRSQTDTKRDCSIAVSNCGRIVEKDKNLRAGMFSQPMLIKTESGFCRHGDLCVRACVRACVCVRVLCM